MFNPCFSNVSMPIRMAIAFPSSAPPQVDDFLGDGTFGRVLLARDTNRDRNRGEAARGRWFERNMWTIYGCYMMF